MTMLRPDVLSLERRVKASRQGLLNLGSNELLHPIVDEVVAEALARCEPMAARFYPSYEATRCRVAEYFEASPDCVLLTAGADDAIRVLVDALTAPEETILLQSPNYDGWETRALLGRRRVRRVAFSALAQQFPYEQYEQLLRAERGRLLALSNPNGPTGHHAPAQDVRRIAELCREREHTLVIDEAYVGFGEPSAVPAYRGDASVVFVQTFSKSLGIAGVRAGAIIAEPSLTAYLSRWQPENPVSGLTMQILSHVIANADRIQEARAEIVASREWFERELQAWAPRWTVLPSAANFVTALSLSCSFAQQVMRVLFEHGVRIKTTCGLLGLPTGLKFTIAHREPMLRVMNLLRQCWPQGPPPTEDRCERCTYR